jgi:vacuolar-type H+-ATPase subunit H
MNGMNIKECAEKIEMVGKYAPIAKYASGTFSGKVKLSTNMDKNWDPIYASVYSKGNIKTKGVKIEGFELLDKLAAITKMESILDQEFENVDIEYEIIDGKGYIKPFDFRIDQLKGNSFGSIDLDQKIDFDVNMEVPTAMLGAGAGMLLGQIAGALSSLGIQSEAPENIDMNIKITGTVDKPKITPNFAGLNPTNAKEVVKETIKEEIDKAKDEAMAKAAAEAEKIMKEAREKAAALLAEAQKNVDVLKKEGYEQADKLVADAKGMLEQIAAKAAAAEMKKQIDKQAANAMTEAKKQADKIIEDAQKQADRLKK